ncbi:hypothetical protein QEN19_003713 [Hanseniaspora menglaensis]
MSESRNGKLKRFDNWTSVLQYYEVKNEKNILPDEYNKIKITKKPEYQEIRNIHIYDFDGTLFYTPNIFYDNFTDRAVNYIIPFKGLVHGGWWCYRESVEAYIRKWIEEKESIPKEMLFNEPFGAVKDGICFCKACKIDSKFWSYDIVKKMQASYESPDTISILMTGRRLDRFYETFDLLLKQKLEHRIVFHNELKVDSIFLKKDYKYTIEYKTKVLRDLLVNFPLVKELIMYDDRTDQIKGMHTWMKNNMQDITKIRYLRNENRPKNIFFDIEVVNPKVGVYESKEQLALIEGLITRNNKNCYEQQISVDVEIYSDFYVAMKQNDVRFLKGLVEYLLPADFENQNFKNKLLGLQFMKAIDFDRRNSKVKWTIDALFFCTYGVFLTVYNDETPEETGVVITHYQDNHRKTVKKMARQLVDGRFKHVIEEKKVLFDLVEDKKLKSKQSNIHECVDVNREYLWSNMDLTDDHKLTFEADFKDMNNMMLIDLKEMENEHTDSISL